MLAVYAVLTFIGAINHEIWFDEGQAWCIARDNDIAGIIDQMKYEGHPPLWHFILYPFAQLGCSVDILPLISWFFSVVTVALIAYKMPFNLIVKGSVIFSGGFLFFNSVISRIYCLIPLILCLIAILYPDRKKHPVLYGLLVALLSVTHIFMCGIVGALGIFMICDLFKDWKKNNTKQNIFNLVGLAVAGIGVILLILPLIGSMSMNQEVDSRQGNIARYFEALGNMPYSLGIEATNHLGILGYISLITIPARWVCYIVVLILIRRQKVAFVTELLFFIFYIIISELIWYSIPNRAAIFVFSTAFSVWLAYHEGSEDKTYKTVYQSSTPLLEKLLTFAKKVDQATIRSGCVCVAIIHILTIPIGAYYLFNDYCKQFTAVKKTAEFVKDNISEDALFVYDIDGVPELFAYLPEYDFFSIITMDDSTYRSFTKPPVTIDRDRVLKAVAEYQEVYMISINKNPTTGSGMEKTVYVCNEGMPYVTQGTLSYIEICEFTEENMHFMIDAYEDKMRRIMT